MSTRYKNGSHYENHQRAAELQNVGAHTHRVGEQQGEAEHLTAHEQSRQTLEHSVERQENQAATTAMVGHGVAAFGHEETAELAHQLWLERGSPEGSPEKDWYDALHILKSRNFAH
jgi:hypothetical protein